jgi:DNA-binding NarL/FixJ family response regulator
MEQANRILQLPVNAGHDPAIGGNHLDGGAEQASRTLLVIDTRVRDRECLAGSIAAQRVDMDVVALGSFADWNLERDLHPPLAAVMVNIGGRLLGGPSVAEEIRKLVSECGATPVIAMADTDELGEIFQALDCGAKGYIPSTLGISVCVEAVSLVLAGGVFVPASCVASASRQMLATSDATERQASFFTSRQSAVVEALKRGKANKIIAYELNMCESTVKVHVRNVMRKLKATNRTEVVYKVNKLFYQDAA